ncbi:hypothetical protein MMC10_000776 [Thelotrema lepadinum]|nr:hypothetical protein [Thelotrema lepadinum]
MSKHGVLQTILPKPFRPPVGRKEVWLPNFTITLLRTPNLPSNMASFIVPLHLNKLDLKDYLWNAYRLPVLAVRSYITQSPVRQDKPGAPNPVARRWYRTRSTKRMIVELGEGEHGGPFVWPDEVKDFEAWDKDMFKAGHGAQEQLSETKYMKQKSFGMLGKQDEDKVREQAKALLEGREEWRPTWMDLKSAKGLSMGKARDGGDVK